MLTATPSILITDDDRDFRETLRVALEPCGFRMYLAGDGQEALDIVRAQEIHVVLLDMHMPRLTGLETIRLVKQLKAFLPCILISAALDEVLLHQAKRAEAFSVLSKPVTRQQLTTVVSSALTVTYGQWQRSVPPGPFAAQ